MIQSELEYNLKVPVEVDVKGRPESFETVVLRAPKNKYSRNAFRIQGVIATAQRKIFEDVISKRDDLSEIANENEKNQSDSEEKTIDIAQRGEALKQQVLLAVGDNDELLEVLEDNFRKIIFNGGLMFGSVQCNRDIWDFTISIYDGESIMWEYIAYFLLSSPKS